MFGKFQILINFPKVICSRVYHEHEENMQLDPDLTQSPTSRPSPLTTTVDQGASRVR